MPGSYMWSYFPSLKWSLSLPIPFLLVCWIILLFSTTLNQLLGIRHLVSVIILTGVPFVAFLINRAEGYFFNFIFTFYLGALAVSSLCFVLNVSINISQNALKFITFASFFLFVLLYPGGRDYFLYNFTDYVPMELINLNVIEPGHPTMKLSIPRAYFKNGKITPDENSITLEFVLPNMEPAFRHARAEKNQTLKVGLDLGPERRLLPGFYGEDQQLSRLLNAGVAPAKRVFELDYYAPSRFEATHLYVPSKVKSSFVIACDGLEPPSDSSCRRLSLPETSLPHFIYWFRGSSLEDWSERESRVQQKISSFIVQDI